MSDPKTVAPLPATPIPTSLLAASELVEQAFTRASGAPLVKGNGVRVLKDGAANYSAWFAAIRAARKTVYFENYIIEEARRRQGQIDARLAGVPRGCLSSILATHGGGGRGGPSIQPSPN